MQNLARLNSPAEPQIRNKESVPAHDAEFVCLLLQASAQVVLLRRALNHTGLQPPLPVLALPQGAGKRSGTLYCILPLRHSHLAPAHLCPSCSQCYSGLLCW